MKNPALTVGAARAALELGTSASRHDIRNAYRRLARQWHPDKCGDSPRCAEKMHTLTLARDLLLAYCDRYRIPLDDTAPADAEAAVLERFYHDWCWGNDIAPHGVTPRARRRG